MTVWTTKYRTMPMSELRAAVDRWRDITNEADRLAKQTGEADDLEHARTCREQLQLSSRIARERQRKLNQSPVIRSANRIATLGESLADPERAGVPTDREE